MSQEVPAIEAEDIVKVYDEKSHSPVRALDGLSLTVRKGEIFGLLGVNGAGKTTLLRILTTLIRPTSGRAAILGVDVIRKPYDVRKQICAVLQENAVEVFLSLEDNLATYARFHSLPRPQVSATMDRVIAQFGLEEFRKKKVIDLSGGLKRRVQVAKVFMTGKPVVFLDEATTGMDPINRRATLDAVREESRRGRTILLTTHLLEEAEELCDRIAIIDRGRVVAVGNPDRIKALGSTVITIRATYESISEEAFASLSRLPVTNVERRHTTIEVNVNGKQISPFDVLQAAGQIGPLIALEVSSGSLEDAFIGLLGAKRPAPGVDR
ncbi:MAG TPA: ABC transporter ATP-binding protein [Bacteroidota bacterium]|nr:ABC transporter ATP-binding protein [Bacteroidota bacterium]